MDDNCGADTFPGETNVIVSWDLFREMFYKIYVTRCNFHSGSINMCASLITYCPGLYLLTWESDMACLPPNQYQNLDNVRKFANSRQKLKSIRPLV